MIIVLDTETAGFKGPIMQLAYSAYQEFSNRHIFDYNALIRHDNEYEVHEDAFKIHGLTHGQCQAKGADAVQSLRDLVSTLKDAKTIVGHKLQFDLAMISKDCFYYGIKFDYTMTDPRFVCTMAKTKGLCNLKDIKGRPKFPSLTELHYRLFGETFEGAHDALADVKATAKCFFELKRLGIVHV